MIFYAPVLQIIVRGDEPNEGIYYEFTLPALNVSSSKHFLWKLSDWSACTVSCGGSGLQYREPICYENGRGKFIKLKVPNGICISFHLFMFIKLLPI